MALPRNLAVFTHDKGRRDALFRVALRAIAVVQADWVGWKRVLCFVLVLFDNFLGFVRYAHEVHALLPVLFIRVVEVLDRRPAWRAPCCPEFDDSDCAIPELNGRTLADRAIRSIVSKQEGGRERRCQRRPDIPVSWPVSRFGLSQWKA